VPALAEVVQYTNEFLRVAHCDDWPNALNGLQVENAGEVQRIGAAVDASSRTCRAAAEKGIDLLLVHHGLFWPGAQAITGPVRAQLMLLFERNIALYSAHLPLDVHPVIGNNAQLAATLGLPGTEPFFEAKGQLIGLRSAGAQIPRSELTRKLEEALGASVKLFAHGPEIANNVAVITGGAGSEIHAVARAGIDTFITGEAPHWAAIAAEELGINLLLGGHYATETFGVKALAGHLADRFGVPWEFIDAPTGL